MRDGFHIYLSQYVWKADFFLDCYGRVADKLAVYDLDNISHQRAHFYSLSPDLRYSELTNHLILIAISLPTLYY